MPFMYIQEGSFSLTRKSKHPALKDKHGGKFGGKIFTTLNFQVQRCSQCVNI